MEVRKSLFRIILSIGHESARKKGRESSLIRQSYLNKSIVRPGSSHHGRMGIPDTFTPPCRNHSSKKKPDSENCQQITSKNKRQANGKRGRDHSLGYFNKNSNSCVNSSFRKPQAYHRNSRDNHRHNSGSNSSKNRKGSKTSHGRSKIKSSNKEKNREKRCGSSIAAHKLNSSLFGNDIESMLLDKKRSSKKINIRSRSKSKKSPKSKKFEDTFADPSFQHTNLNMSQMFNYYSNYPTKEFLKNCTSHNQREKSHSRKFSKNLQHAYRSYTSNSVNKRGKSKMKNKQPSILLQALNRKSKNIANILDVPLVKHSKSSNKNKAKNGGKLSTHAKVLASIKDWTDAQYTRMDRQDQYNSSKKHKDNKKNSSSFLFNFKNANPSGSKKKRSGKRSRCRDETASRAKSRDKVENKTLECNSAINTYQNSIMRKDQSPLSFFCPENLQFKDESGLMIDRMQESMKLTSQLSSLEKVLKRKIREICSNEQISVASEKENLKYSSEAEEEKVECVVQTLLEISEIHPFSTKLFVMIKEGVEDCLQRLHSREKFKNICLKDSLKKAESELKKERVERELLECQYAEMQQRIKTMHKLDQEYDKLKKQLDDQEKGSLKFREQIQWLQNREEEVIKRLDLNEIDLQTERLGVFGVEVDNNKQKETQNPKIPPLNMDKLKLMKERDEYDYEEEEEEEDSDVEKEYLEDGSLALSENKREDELRRRKEQVISLLNQTFHENDH
ncbi:unnamed protein product [Moneuplotes crassus]|uniref:Uncharacterized protein n=1 Tax=Euplotes crassus TaxID=5936 RepID=A0AAD1Y2G9_EUPCR|nr:unnamed protein product [Moneuplotes crassus]